jgi:hypothetical protein
MNKNVNYVPINSNEEKMKKKSNNVTLNERNFNSFETNSIN